MKPLMFLIVMTLAITANAEPASKDKRVEMWMSFSSIAAADPSLVSDILAFQGLYLNECGRKIVNPITIRNHPEFANFQYAMTNPKWVGIESMKWGIRD